ncbi:hypothetical protein PMAYCL1PPCAC_14044, partial [Pristionchus mayeri]
GMLWALSGLLHLTYNTFAYPESHVQFPHSEVIVNEEIVVPWPYGPASFKCSGGCRVYSPTQSDFVTIQEKSGKIYKSLRELSNMKPGQPYELPVG